MGTGCSTASFSASTTRHRNDHLAMESSMNMNNSGSKDSGTTTTSTTTTTTAISFDDLAQVCDEEPTTSASINQHHGISGLSHDGPHRRDGLETSITSERSNLVSPPTQSLASRGPRQEHNNDSHVQHSWKEIASATVDGRRVVEDIATSCGADLTSLPDHRVATAIADDHQHPTNDAQPPPTAIPKPSPPPPAEPTRQPTSAAAGPLLLLVPPTVLENYSFPHSSGSQPGSVGSWVAAQGRLFCPTPSNSSSGTGANTTSLSTTMRQLPSHHHYCDGRVRENSAAHRESSRERKKNKKNLVADNSVSDVSCDTNSWKSATPTHAAAEGMLDDLRMDGGTMFELPRLGSFSGAHSNVAVDHLNEHTTNKNMVVEVRQQQLCESNTHTVELPTVTSTTNPSHSISATLAPTDLENIVVPSSHLGSSQQHARADLLNFVASAEKTPRHENNFSPAADNGQCFVDLDLDVLAVMATGGAAPAPARGTLSTSPADRSLSAMSTPDSFLPESAPRER